MFTAARNRELAAATTRFMSPSVLALLSSLRRRVYLVGLFVLPTSALRPRRPFLLLPDLAVSQAPRTRRRTKTLPAYGRYGSGSRPDRVQGCRLHLRSGCSRPRLFSLGVSSLSSKVLRRWRRRDRRGQGQGYGQRRRAPPITMRPTAFLGLPSGLVPAAAAFDARVRPCLIHLGASTTGGLLRCRGRDRCRCRCRCRCRLFLGDAPEESCNSGEVGVVRGREQQCRHVRPSPK